MPACPRCVTLAFVLLLAAFLGACDTDNPSSSLEELEGLYDFTELRFDPAASAIADADVLARLVASNSNVELFGTGRAIVRFDPVEGPSDFVEGSFTATRSRVTLTVPPADASRLAPILLPTPVPFSRNSDDRRLTAQIATTADLAAFDPEAYDGVPPVPGTLYVTLQRRGE